MSILDFIIVLLLIASAVMGMKRGVIRELVMLVGVIVIYFIAFALKGHVGLLLCKIFPFFGFEGLVSLNIIMYQLIAFVLIASLLFSVYALIFRFTGIIQKLVDISIILTLPSKILGLIVGFIEGYIILFMILLVLQIPFKDNSIFINSRLSNQIVNNSFLLSSSLGELDDCIIDITNITKNYDKAKSNQINLEIIRLELKYGIISKEDLQKIIETKKLDEINGVRNI